MNLTEKIKLIIPLCLISIITFTLSFFYDYGGILINLSTEIIGIIVTIIYVEHLIDKNKKNEWKRVSVLLKSEIYYISNAIVTTFRTAFGIKPEDFFGYMQMLDLVDMSEGDQASRVIELYNLKISKKIYFYITNMNEKSYKNLINGLSEIYNATINFQSMYNSISNPKQIETIMNIKRKTHHIIKMLQLFPEFYTMSDEVFRSFNDDKQLELKKISQEKLSIYINNLIDELGAEVKRIDK